MFTVSKSHQQFSLNIDIIRQDITEKKYTDCTITFVDHYRSLDMSCHKIILLSASDYFRNAFSSGNTDHITIQAYNAQIMRDVVLSFYGTDLDNHHGYHDWEYLLQTFLCRNYLLLDSDVSELYDLEVPERGFELLMQVLTVYDLSNNEKLLSVIRENLPVQYNLPDYLQKILAKKRFIIVCDCNKIDTLDIENGELINSYSYNGYIASISSDGKLVVTVDDQLIKLLDDNLNLIREIHNRHGQIRQIIISHNKKFLVLAENTMFHIYYTENGQHDRTVYHRDYIAISHDDQTIAYLSNTCEIHVRNVGDGQLINFLKPTSIIYRITYSRDDKYILFCDCNGIKVWDIGNKQLIQSLILRPLDMEIYRPYDIKVLHDGRYIIMFTASEVLRWDTTNKLPLLKISDITLDNLISKAFGDLITWQSKYDNIIKIFNVSNGKLVMSLPRDKPLFCMTFV